MVAAISLGEMVSSSDILKRLKVELLLLSIKERADDDAL